MKTQTNEAKFTQTAEEASAKLIRFDSKELVQAFIETHNILALPHCSGAQWIAICLLPQGVFGISSPTTCELLPEW